MAARRPSRQAKSGGLTDTGPPSSWASRTGTAQNESEPWNFNCGVGRGIRQPELNADIHRERHWCRSALFIVIVRLGLVLFIIVALGLVVIVAEVDE